MTAAEAFYRHFRDCPVCRFGITWETDQLCGKGKDIQHDLILALCDERYEEEQHAMERHIEQISAHVAVLTNVVGGRVTTGETDSTMGPSLTRSPRAPSPTTLIPGEYNSDDLDRLVR